MIKVMCLVPDRSDSTSFYRAIGPLSQITEFELVFPDVVTWDRIKLCDVVFLQRPYYKDQLGILTLSKDMNKPVWVDLDDALDLVPETNPAFFEYRDHSNFYEILKHADLITVSTIALKNRYSKLNNNIVVVNNGLDENWIKYKNHGLRKKNITWRGSSSHESDIVSCRAQIKKLIEIKNKNQFIFMGHISPEVVSYGKKKRRLFKDD